MGRQEQKRFSSIPHLDPETVARMRGKYPENEFMVTRTLNSKGEIMSELIHFKNPRGENLQQPLKTPEFFRTPNKICDPLTPKAEIKKKNGEERIEFRCE